jgi:hypothetical protein
MSLTLLDSYIVSMHSEGGFYPARTLGYGRIVKIGHTKTIYMNRDSVFLSNSILWATRRSAMDCIARLSSSHQTTNCEG